MRVKFHGHGRSGPLTMAQRNVLWIMQNHSMVDLVQSATIPLASGSATLPAVADALRWLVERHETLRTLIVAGDPPRQIVRPNGWFDVAVRDAADAVAVRQILGRPFGFDDLPLRAAVLMRAGRPIELALTFSHLAADLLGVRVATAELRGTLGIDPQSGPSTVWHPIDQAGWERGPTGRRRADAALEYWRKTLRRAPQAMFAMPDPLMTGERYGHARLRSHTVSLAAAQIARRCRTSRSAVLLAAMSALIGHYTSHRACVLASLAANRTERRLHHYVGTLAQDALIVVPLYAETFDDVVIRAWPATLTAYRHSRFDAGQLWEAIEELRHQRGTDFARDFVFNDQSPVGGPADARLRPGFAAEARPELTGAPRRSTLDWLIPEPQEATVVFYLHHLDGEAEISLWADGRRLSAHVVEALLRGVELLLAAAAHRTVPIAALSDVTGVEPVRRGARWTTVDSCWVDLDAVRRLVREIPGVQNAEVAVGKDAGGTNRLYARVHAAPGVHTPASLRKASAARLPGRLSVVLPHDYAVTWAPA